MAVVNGIRDRVGVGFPPDGANVSTATEPWTPRVGDRVVYEAPGRERHWLHGEAGEVKKAGDGWAMVVFDRQDNVLVHYTERLRRERPPVAAVVVRGLGGGDTARVVLCRSEEEAVREQRANGGVVVGLSQVDWA